MNSSIPLVKAYLQAIGRGDFATARTYLDDKVFNYTSPIGDFDSADHFIDNISSIETIMEELTIRHLSATATEVIAVIDIRITLYGYMTRTAVVLCTLNDEKIHTMEVIFDASAYQQMFAADEPARPKS